mmetsp:Transcript_34162/g.59685  ORF Transcript_34162/g.59685 Transcript_34162/m.59685 type:complete len:330 (-) Transcript_34162:1493-2482(-)
MAVYAREEVAHHNKPSDCWVIYKGAVVNVTSFIDNHPGGRNLILPFLGNDITQAFDEVGHTAGALGVIEEYQIGTTPDNQFSFAGKDIPQVDPARSVVSQVFSMDLEKYKVWINHPTLSHSDARLFDFEILEKISRVPLHYLHYIWLSAAFYYYWSANLTFQCTLITTFVIFGLWTLIEYLLHRFPFHMELFIPNNPYLIVLHFLLHGVHHVYPFDKLRLPIFQPLSIALFLVLRIVTWIFLPDSLDLGVFAALLLCYVYYETFHYANHFGAPEHFYLTFMKTYHLKHHFGEAYEGYGVTNKIWDFVFKTEIKLPRSLLAEVRANVISL